MTKANRMAQVESPVLDPSIETLLDSTQRTMQVRDFSASTQKSYMTWARRFLAAVGHARLEDITESDVAVYMAELTRSGRYKTATLAQVRNAIRFLFRASLQPAPEWLDDATNVERRVAPPVILSGEEAAQVLAHLRGGHRLMAWLAYGAGLRLMEVVTLRVGDVSVRQRHVRIANEDGSSRINPLPKIMMPSLKSHLEWVEAQHELDCRAGYGYTVLPADDDNSNRLNRNLTAQFLFPSTQLTTDEATSRIGRPHVSVKGLQRAIMQAGRDAGITRQVTASVLRGTFAAEKLASGSDPNRVMALMGHKTLTATLRYAQASLLDMVQTTTSRLLS